MSHFIIGGTNVTFLVTGGTNVGWHKCQVGMWHFCLVALMTVGQKSRHPIKTLKLLNRLKKLWGRILQEK
jgi:hypothetical protein